MTFTPTQLRLAEIDVEQRWLLWAATAAHLRRLSIQNDDEGRADVAYILAHIQQRVTVLKVIRGRLKEIVQ